MFEFLTALNIRVERVPELSDRVCKSCARKIRNASGLFTWIHSSINVSRSCSESEKPREKRQLPTTVSTPERSPQARKQQKSATGKNDRKVTSKRSLFNENPTAEPQAENDNANENRAAFDMPLAAMNIEQLVDSCKTSTQVKVIIVNPNGRVHQINEFHEITKTLIVNLTQKKWKTVAKAMFKHPCLKAELIAPLKRCISDEFKNYCSDSSESMLKQSSPVDLEAFSNKFLVSEVRQWCPLWMACVSGACKASSDASSLKTKQINTIALASAIVARCRNQKMTAVSYRISALLFHSGTKYDDIKRLHKLSVCMSPHMIVEMQRKMGESCERKVLQWKSEIENNKKAKLLLDEVKEKQVCSLVEENDMELEVEVDFSEESICKYTTYNAESYKHCKELLNAVKKDDNCPLNDEHLVTAISVLSCEKLPLYK